MLFSGTVDSNVVCQRCPNGTFSDTVSYTDRCRPHTEWVKDSNICTHLFWVLRSLTSSCFFPAVKGGLLSQKVLLPQTTNVRLWKPTKPLQKPLILRMCLQLQVQWWVQSHTRRLYKGRQTPHCLSAPLFQRQGSTKRLHQARHLPKHLVGYLIRYFKAAIMRKLWGLIGVSTFLSFAVCVVFLPVSCSPSRCCWSYANLHCHHSAVPL